MEPCRACGRELELDDDTFCPHCGAILNAADALWEKPEMSTLDKEPAGTRDLLSPGQQKKGILAFEEDREPEEDSQYAVISTGQYIICLLLMLIPLVGLFFAARWSESKEKRINLKNLGQAVIRFQVILWGTVIFFWLIAIGLMQWGNFRGIM